MKRYYLVMGGIFFVLGLFNVPAEEIRAIWVTRWEYRTPEHIYSIIDNVADHNFNYVLFQVRGNGTVFYESAIEPWAWELSGTDPSTLGIDPGWNPLEIAIQRAHDRGLKILAYMNAYPAWLGTSPPPPDVPQLWNDHPDWLCVNSDGATMTLNEHYVSLSPGIPSVQNYLHDVYLEVVNRYDVDGVHFDYIRYPAWNYSWDTISLKRFFDQYGGTPETMPDEWAQFRRDQVTELVDNVYRDAVTTRTDIHITAATWPTFNNGYNALYQDFHGWLNKGILDISHPMTYSNNVDDFIEYATEHVEHSADRFVALGIGASRISSSSVFVDQVEVSRQLGSHGLTVFSYSYLFPSHTPNSLAQKLVADKFKYPDDIPPLLWKISSGDDDNTGPRIRDFATSPTIPFENIPIYILSSISDPGGVYDDNTTSNGQGVHIRWAIDKSPLTSARTIGMHNMGGDLFINDAPLLMPPLGHTLYYQVIAYDDDSDQGNPDDRARRISPIMSIIPQFKEKFATDYDIVSGPRSTVFDNGDTTLRYHVSDKDLLNSMIANCIGGGFLSASYPMDETARLATLTDGVWAQNTLTVICDDYGEFYPDFGSLVLEYAFSQPVRIADIRIFAGHHELGDRAWINVKIDADDGISTHTLVKNLTTGIYGQSRPDESTVSVVRLYASEQEYMISNIKKLKFTFYNVSHNSSGAFKAYDDNGPPENNYPNQGTILKEIDVFGSIAKVRLDAWQFY